MSLDVHLMVVQPVSIWSDNVTHNLVPMAKAAGIYEAVWRPDEHGLTTAAQLIPILEEGIARLEAEPEKYCALNPSNGWGSYDDFLPWLKQYRDACKQNPGATVEVSR